MAKVTSKLQVTIPRKIADHYGIRPGDEIEFQEAGSVIRVLPPGEPSGGQLSDAERLRLFDEATERQRRREEKMQLPAGTPAERGWTREELYDRETSR